MKKPSFLVILFMAGILIAGLKPAPAMAAGEKMIAVWYQGYYDNLDEAQVKADLVRFKDTGFNTILLVGYVTQKDMFSIEVQWPGEEFVKKIGRVSDLAHEAGFQVGLTVFLLVDDGTWRGLIQPRDPKAWFESFGALVAIYADFARERKIEMFAIGSEMESLKFKGEFWKPIVEKTRELYQGLVAFNINWWSSPALFTALMTDMGWLEAVDIVGFSGYFPLTNKINPTLDEMKSGWSRNAGGMNVMDQTRRFAEKYKKKVVFWEVGYRSIKGANTAPWNFSLQNDPSQEEQADCFSAFFSAMMPLDFVSGVGIWDESMGLKPSEAGYGFMGKLGEKSIADGIKSLGK